MQLTISNQSIIANQRDDGLIQEIFLTCRRSHRNLKRKQKLRCRTAGNSNDLATQLTLEENAILEMPITERPINSYKNKIIIPHSPNCLLLSITATKIFKNFKHTLALTRISDITEMTKQI